MINDFIDKRDSIDSGDFINTSNSGRYTSGGRDVRPYVPQEVVRIIEPVLNALSKTENRSIVDQVGEVIGDIVELVLRLNGSKLEISNLPPLYGTNLDDGSFLIEWISTKYRVGFIIDPDPKESIWYLITRGESSDSTLSGSLTSHESKATLSQLVSYVALNS